MRYLVLGAGALGGYFGGMLIKGGADVTFLVRPKRAAQLQREGLVVKTQDGGELRTPVKTVQQGQLDGPFDAILLSCKAYDLDGAMDAIAPAMTERTVIVPVLNGVRHIDRLTERFGRGRVLGGLTIINAALMPDGTIQQSQMRINITMIGELDGQSLRGGHDGDDLAARTGQLFDNGELRRVVHAHRQHLAGDGDRQHRVAARVVAVDEPGQRAIDRHPIEHDVRDAELRRQRLPHRGIVDIAKLDDDLAERTACLLVNGQRMFELLARDGAAANEDLAKTRPLAEGIEYCLELARRDDSLVDEDLPERDALVLPFLPGEGRLQLCGGDETLLNQQFPEANFSEHHATALALCALANPAFVGRSGRRAGGADATCSFRGNKSSAPDGPWYYTD